MCLKQRFESASVFSRLEGSNGHADELRLGYVEQVVLFRDADPNHVFVPHARVAAIFHFGVKELIVESILTPRVDIAVIVAGRESPSIPQNV
jgi:hypothetical protein